jgi:VacB/RNase II family 3'-5' exoribonuclease
MLSSDILSQLSTLKKEIRANTDTAQGTVRGTAGRYGFVSLDDGRDAFLNPEQMDKLFHGDRIEVTVTQNDKEQYEAKVEKLIHSPLKQVAGRYCIKGKGHFVIYENQQHSRWIFVPPKARANAKEGHYVTARITQHPYETGKAQARVISDIGTEVNAETARLYTLAMFQLFDNFPKDVQEEAQTLQSQDILPSDQRTDLRNTPFVTIDSANTRDMDDALSIEKREEGWELLVAIADPGSEITTDSALDNIALRRGQTLYLPGKSIPMLPESLSVERYSLVSGKDKLALVCKLSIANTGEVKSYSFESAIINSKAKLSYQQVSALLNEKTYTPAPQLDDAEPFKEQLTLLKQCAEALNGYRKANQLVTDNKADFMLLLNDKGKLESIEKIERTDAHVIVEESMIATNQSAGQFFAQYHESKNKAGLFMTHPGYREERREDVEKLLSEQLGDNYTGETNKLNSYIANIRFLQNSEEHKNLFAVQQRFHQGSEPSSSPAPHFGLGSEYYSTVTSPIRRYQDLYNQRVIHQILANKKATTLRKKQVERLKESITNSRNASRLMEQWLIADYMQSHVGETFTGYIALLTNQGVGIRLRNNEVEGFIAGAKEDKNNPEAPIDKISFNNQRMTLTWNDKELFLEQDVKVKLASVDMDRKKLIFEWAE